MKPSYGKSIVIGALIGLVVSMATLLVVGATGGVSKLGIIGEGADIEPAFAVPASAMWIVVAIAGAAVGLVLAIATRAFSRVIDPDAKSVSSALVGVVGAVVGAVVAIAVFPVGSSALGEIKDGVATVTVAQVIILTAITGISTGGGVVWLSYVMARPPQQEDDPELLAA